MDFHFILREGRAEVFFFLVGYVEERPWWPIQCPNKGRKKKASSQEVLRKSKH